MLWPITIERLGPDNFVATVPDLPGCQARADSLERALTRARPVIEQHIAGLLADGDNVPEPSRIEDLRVRQDSQNQDRNWFVIHVQLAQLTALAAHQFRPT